MASVQTIHPAPLPSSSPADNTPTTPRMHAISPSQHRDEDMATTPTSLSFAEANGKRSLPKSPPPPAHATLPGRSVGFEESRRPVSQRSNKSGGSQDVDMQIEDEEEDSGDDVDDSVDGETGRPTKKKKGQRFFCTDYPPCNLSFTRSEHLARHIRKHTGERPFQCHCNRRFSRLDNLRQHAQTVHVNEEIPGDSLAATGTRFQRQIRTDRVRPAGARSRASTTSSQTSHGRGHARNLSTSSIASTASNVSTISSMSQDPRNYPQPLGMAPEHRNSGLLTIDTMRASPGFSYQSSAGPSTPTSTHYSQGTASPYGSTIGSPISSHRFSAPQFETRTARRLSVPSGVNPFPNGPSPQFVGTLSPGSGFTSNNPSALASPTSSVFSNRMEQTNGEGELKRRTWHPSTYTGGYYQRPATSGLSYSQTPDAPRPAFAAQQPAAATQQSVRLPGFGDLMQTIHRPATPPGQISQPVTESPSRPPLMTAGSSSERSAGLVERPAHRSLDMSFYQNLNKLDIASGTPPRESAAWGQQVLADMSSAASNVQTPPAHQQAQVQAQPIAPGQQPLAPAPPPAQAPSHVPIAAQASIPSHSQPHGMETDQQATASRNRRQGWYQGPIAPAPQVVTTVQQHRVSPASSSSEGVPTPSNPTFEHHPAIVHSNSYGEPAPIQGMSQTVYTPVAPKPDLAHEQRPLSGLDALVAVATSESHNRDAIGR